MDDRNRGIIAIGVWLSAALAFVCLVGPAVAADAARPSEATAPAALPALPMLPVLIESGAVAVETVVFTDQQHSQVRVVRGRGGVLPLAAVPPHPIPALRTETVSFGTGFADRVTVVRGGAVPTVGVQLSTLAMPTRIEKVAFANPYQPPVTVMRGAVSRDISYSLAPASIELFDPANGGELDRIAFAVDGIESRHGADLRMWRPGLDGPQGPMQVSAAAALDVGGGDRFDPHQNRLLGRAYLAQMFEHYGNWSDAVAAYNWGPGNMDQWIIAGRNAERLPIGVNRYINRVLRDAFITNARL